MTLRLDNEAPLECTARVQEPMEGAPGTLGQDHGIDSAVRLGPTRREPDANRGRSAPAAFSIWATKAVA